ncbi:MAG: hypothetical protein HYT76_02140 [Deltaproteobacteria bacterium]|nr:hypothetical protein [Deltaproteobacteria bacterium]
MKKIIIRFFVSLLLILSLTTETIAQTHWRKGAVIGGLTGAGIGVVGTVSGCIGGGCWPLVSSLFIFGGGFFGFNVGALIGEAFTREEPETTHARRGFWTGEITGYLVGAIASTLILTAPNIGSGDSDGVPELTAALLTMTALPGTLGLIGWGIGSGISKNKTVSLQPILLSDENEVVPGVGLKMEF